MQSCSVEELFNAIISRDDICLLDARSPAEFSRGAIPGAHLFPLFYDTERHQVGLTYHTSGRDAAIKVGLELVGPRLRQFIEDAERLSSGCRRLILYCWRGGMRSAALAWLLDLYGFDVLTLRGGYKAFRRYVLATLDQTYRFILIGGMTGAGKTDLLSSLADHGEATIDLERLASHRGSAFGALGLPPQPTQQQFENMLAVELWKHRNAPRIWIEDESRHIGQRVLPLSLWQQMQSAPILALDVPLEQRIERLIQEYGAFPPEQLAECLRAIRERLGAERYAKALAALEHNRLEDVASLALVHYDKSYQHSLRKRADRIVWVHSRTPEDVLAALASTPTAMQSPTSVLQ